MADAPAPPGPETVMIGLDGHLFERDGYTIEQIGGALTLSSAQVTRWAALIETRHAWCRQRGMQYYFVVTPEKQVVYEDKLPPGIAVSDQRPIARIIAALGPEQRDAVVYPDEILRNERATEETYYKTDTHWTNFGAYLAYLRVLASMQRDDGIERMPVTTLARTQYRKVGDLGIRLTPERTEMATRVANASEGEIRRVFSNRTYFVGQVEVFERPGATGPRAVMFRDSSGSYMLPFLAAHCARLVAVASDGVYYDLLRSEKPGLVITQMTERALYRPDERAPGGLLFPNDMPPVDFEQFTGVPLPLPTSRDNFVDIDFSKEPAPVWSVGRRTEMVLTCRVPYAPCDLELTASAFVHPPRVPSQRLNISVNSTRVGSFVAAGYHETFRCRVPLECLYSARALRLEFFHPDCVSPRELGAGTDERALSLKFERLVLRAAA